MLSQFSRPYRQNCVRGNESFEVHNGAASTFVIGPAIADFDLFGVVKGKLQGIRVSDDEELKSEILTIFQGIPSDELNKSFDHWIERCQWVAANAGNDYPSRAKLILSMYFSLVPILNTYWTTYRTFACDCN
jgi:hypothetical protein